MIKFQSRPQAYVIKNSLILVFEPIQRVRFLLCDYSVRYELAMTSNTAKLYLILCQSIWGVSLGDFIFLIKHILRFDFFKNSHRLGLFDLILRISKRFDISEIMLCDSKLWLIVGYWQNRFRFQYWSRRLILHLHRLSFLLDCHHPFQHRLVL